MHRVSTPQKRGSAAVRSEHTRARDCSNCLASAVAPRAAPISNRSVSCRGRGARTRARAAQSPRAPRTHAHTHAHIEVYRRPQRARATTSTTCATPRAHAHGRDCVPLLAAAPPSGSSQAHNCASRLSLLSTPVARAAATPSRRAPSRPPAAANVPRRVRASEDRGGTHEGARARGEARRERCCERAHCTSSARGARPTTASS